MLKILMLPRSPAARASALVAVCVGLAIAPPSAQKAATAPSPSKTPVQMVWPPPPDEPRVRYVGTYASIEDVSAERKARTLSLKQALLGKGSVAGATKTPNGFVRPFGVAVDGFGRIIVADTAQAAVFVVDSARHQFISIGENLRQPLFRVPVGVAVDSANNIYIGDSGLRQILVFGPDLVFRSTIGERGELEAPGGLAIDESRQRLYAVDSRKHVLNVYNLSTGKLQTRIGKRGDGNGEFNFPTGVAVGPDGRVYITDTMNYRVAIFGPDLKFTKSFGSLGLRPGQFRRPKGIAVDADNVIYVVDSDFNNFQMFNADGQALMWVGEAGERPGQMLLPAGIAIDRASRRIYLCEQMNQRVQIFERIGGNGQ